jgi:hypothetical protein
MGEVASKTLTVGDCVEFLSGPAVLGEVFSAADIEHRAALVRRLRAEFSAEDFEAVLAQVPIGYIEGFEAHDDHFRQGRSELAGKHAQRRRLLDRAGALPYLTFKELLLLTVETVFTVEPSEIVLDDGVEFLSADERAARLAETAMMLQIVRLLTLLSQRDREKYPSAAPLIFLALIAKLLLARRASAWQGEASRPIQVTRPPGQAVLAGPRVARAPGGPGPLLLIAARAASGCARPGGTL